MNKARFRTNRYSIRVFASGLCVLWVVVLAMAVFAQSTQGKTPQASPAQAGSSAGKAAGSTSSTATTPAPPKITGTVTYAQAREAVSKVVGTDALPVWLDTYALSLPLKEAIALYSEFIPKASAARRAELGITAAALASLAGQWENAASFYSLASSNPDALIKAARCWLACGKPDKAAITLQKLDVLIAGKDKTGVGSTVSDIIVQEKIVQAWIYLFEEEPEKAFLAVKDVASTQDKGQAKSNVQAVSGAESLFLLWSIANSSDFASFKAPTKGFEPKALESRLGTEYPNSLESALIKQKCMLLPGNLLLAGLYGSGTNTPVAERSLATAKSANDLASADAKQNEEKQTDTMQLQVGFFSKKENAQALVAVLQKKGFQVSIDEQKTKEGELRWAVIVASQGDWSKTQAKLKDLGYESYLLP
ncbi:MAG TPA: SPOR domain-containing protein [Spirochaetales bacterium]|nr:SPOR domain-containing protein [Spirochaetales bacterium]